tara:strand:- start:673 stop:1803 length:1131 start_codon:yes stop_codon:yes gene_type:complete
MVEIEKVAAAGSVGRNSEIDSSSGSEIDSGKRKKAGTVDGKKRSDPKSRAVLISPRKKSPRRPTDSDQSPRRKNGDNKQRAIEDEIAKWAGSSSGSSSGNWASRTSSETAIGPSAEGEEVGDDRQAAIAKQVALWAASEETGKKKRAMSRSRSSDLNVSKRVQHNKEGNGKSSHTYSHPQIPEGKYELAVWKTNTKIKSVRARVVVKSSKDGEILLSRVLQIVKQDVVAKSSFDVAKSEAPASVNVVLNFSQAGASGVQDVNANPVSVTLQQVHSDGSAPTDLNMTVCTTESDNTQLVKPEECRGGVQMCRALTVRVVGARDVPMSSVSNPYVTVDINQDRERTVTLWKSKVITFPFFSFFSPEHVSCSNFTSSVG